MHIDTRIRGNKLIVVVNDMEVGSVDRDDSHKLTGYFYNKLGLSTDVTFGSKTYRVSTESYQKLLSDYSHKTMSVEEARTQQNFQQFAESMQKRRIVHWFKEYHQAREMRSATTIQKHFRGWLGRQRAAQVSGETLAYPLFERAKKLLVDQTTLEAQPEAEMGKTTVYLPTDCPVAIKLSGGQAARTRLVKKSQAKEILNQIGGKHLVIPKARVHGEFIIEERLLISQWTITEQACFYLDHQEDPELENVIKEFTRFLVHSDMTDLIGRFGDSRYDNVPLYRDSDGTIKMGLVDLEHFRPRHLPLSREHLERVLHKIALLFPHHLDAAIEAVGADHTFEIDPVLLQSLEDKKERRLNRYKRNYTDHLEFLKTHGLIGDSCSRLIEVSDEKKQEIARLVTNKITEGMCRSETEVTEELTSGSISSFFNMRSYDEFRKKVQEDWMPLVVHGTLVRLEQLLNRNLAGDRPASFPRLASKRSIYFHKSNKFFCAPMEFPSSPKEASEEWIAYIGLSQFINSEGQEMFVDLIFDELVSQGVVLRYERSLGGASNVGLVYC